MKVSIGLYEDEPPWHIAVHSKYSSSCIEQLLPSCWAALDLIIRHLSLLDWKEEFEVHEIHNRAIGCL